MWYSSVGVLQCLRRVCVKVVRVLRVRVLECAQPRVITGRVRESGQEEGVGERSDFWESERDSAQGWL
jgi:hypothetical protein